MQPIIVIYAIWVFWFLCWLASSMLDGRTKKLTLPQEALYRAVTVVGSLTLLFGFLPDPSVDLKYKLWSPLEEQPGWIMIAITFVAFCFSLWARVCLGFALPGSTKKHLDFVEKGPYRLMRQPIYFSLVIAAFATAGLFGKPSSLGGAILLTLAFLTKIYIEENALRADSDAYEAYSRRVPALIPFLPMPDSAQAARQPKKTQRVKLPSKPRPRVPTPPTRSVAERVIDSTPDLASVFASPDQPAADDPKLRTNTALAEAREKAEQLSLMLDEPDGATSDKPEA